MIHGSWAAGLVASLWLSMACRAEEPKVPPPEGPDPNLENVDPNWEPSPGPAKRVSNEPDQAEASEASERAKPAFTDGMSVEEAIKAVPPGYDYVGLEQEVMERPLRDPATYAPCKNFHTARYKLRVAIWEGRAVGIDVTAPPAIQSCIIDQIKKIEWRDKVEAINTIEYSN